MDRLEKCREVIRQAVCAIAAEIPPEEGMRTEMFCDDARSLLLRETAL